MFRSAIIALTSSIDWRKHTVCLSLVLTIEQKWKFTGLLLRGELDPEKNAMSDKE